MPTYDYACTHCDHAFEIVQSFTDDALTVCPECGGRLRKVFGSVGVVFKGSGFYRTDSRNSSHRAGEQVLGRQVVREQVVRQRVLAAAPSDSKSSSSSSSSSGSSASSSSSSGSGGSTSAA